MSRWYERRWWVYAGLISLLLLDAVIYFDRVRRPAADPGIAQTQIAALEQEVAKYSAEVSRLRRVREKVPQLRPRLDEFIAQHLASERAGFSAVAADLQESASKAGVVLEAVSYGTDKEQPQPDLLKTNVNATLEGQYTNLLRFLEELDHSPRFYLIDELSLVGTRRGRLRLEMRLATFFRRDDT